MLVLLRRASFWPLSMVFISVIIICTLQITIFHMLDLCGQLSCSESTHVFLTIKLNITSIKTSPYSKSWSWWLTSLVQSLGQNFPIFFRSTTIWRDIENVRHFKALMKCRFINLQLRGSFRRFLIFLYG